MKKTMLLVLVAIFGVLAQSYAQHTYFHKDAIAVYQKAKTIGTQGIIDGYTTRDVVDRILSLYKATSKSDPRIHTAWINQAIAYATLQRYDSALLSLSQGLKNCEAKDDRAETFLYRGYIEEESGHVDLANKSYDSALAIYNADPFRNTVKIMRVWEATLARKGLDVATEYLRSEMAAGGMDSIEVHIFKDLMTTPAAKGMGRPKYIHSKACGATLVSPREMNDIRMVYNFYESFVKEFAKPSQDSVEILKNKFLTPALLDKIKGDNGLIMNLSAEELKKHDYGGIGIRVMDKGRLYKVAYYQARKEFRRAVVVHLTDQGDRILIDEIKPLDL